MLQGTVQCVVSTSPYTSVPADGLHGAVSGKMCGMSIARNVCYLQSYGGVFEPSSNDVLHFVHQYCVLLTKTAFVNRFVNTII